MTRVAIVVLALALLAGGGYGLLQVVNSRDDAGIAHPGSGGPGQAAKGTCPAVRVDIKRDGGVLSKDQVLTALAQGNVVISGPDTAALRAIQEQVSGPFDSELAAAGQMVIVAKADAPAARAWERTLAAGDAATLREFAEFWLGKATNSCA